MATIGQVLKTPESGWIQLDENKIKYVGSAWSDVTSTVYTGGTMKVTNSIGDYFEFVFTGTSFRLIGDTYTNRSKNISITIDGVTETFSQYSSNSVVSVLTYEKLGLELKQHTVKVQLTEAQYMNIDRIDINEPIKKSIVKNPTTNQHYSLDNKTLIHLPSSSDKNMILHGIESGKEIKLDEDFDKMKYVQDTSEVLGEGKIFTHAVDMNNTKVNKIIL